MTKTNSRLKPKIKRLKLKLNKFEGSSRIAGKQVDIILTDDSCISQLAGQYRGSFAPTDVLAFFYGTDEISKSAPVGDIVISLDTALRQSRERRMSLDDELLLLSLHGLLHLDGQGDETPKDWCDMRKKEFKNMMRLL